jgi:hypothetical protein
MEAYQLPDHEGGLMNCAYCLEEMNPAATVCKVCAREQPPSSEVVEQRREHWAFILIAGGFVGVVGVYCFGPHLIAARRILP